MTPLLINYVYFLFVLRAKSAIGPNQCRDYQGASKAVSVVVCPQGALHSLDPLNAQLLILHQILSASCKLNITHFR